MNETLYGGAENPALAQEPKQSVRGLYRHPTNRVLAGVCGGVADWLGWDAVVVRLLWIVLAFATSGAGFVVYLLLALLLPVGTQQTGATKRAPIDTRLQAGKPLALILIGLGVLWLLNNLGILPGLSHFLFGTLRLFFWPVLLIVIGWRILRALGVEVGDGAAFRRQMSGWGERVAEWGDGVRASTQNGAADGESRAVNTSATGLWRSSSDRVLLGVCGGIAERYQVDPVLVRLLWAMLALATMGLGLVAYLVVALLLPVKQSGIAPAATGATATGATATGATATDPNAVEEIPVQSGPVEF